MKKPSKPTTSRRVKRIGIIAEDHSDVGVLNQLIGKIAKSPYTIRPFAAGGCGKMLGKADAWSKNLYDQGCRYLILVRDLDKENPATLHGSLVSALGDILSKSRIVVIPVREIEAWLLADNEAIFRAMKLKKILAPIANPEAVADPKKLLARLIYTNSEHTRRYINAIHNEKIAAECSYDSLLRCNSFKPFAQFIEQHI
ncbi:MAG: DUF4276 family protein [Methylovirgula sp.]|uniref:DUF4276 family protein n=1 Tax=Methylovirgula sp. TaxID=1978224 RepID=UPI0030766F0D